MTHVMLFKIFFDISDIFYSTYILSKSLILLFIYFIKKDEMEILIINNSQAVSEKDRWDIRAGNMIFF